MIALLASAVVAGYLPGALIFRLPILDRHRRAALDPAERAFWAVVISATLTLTISLSLAAVGHYQWRNVLLADLLVVTIAAAAGRRALAYDDAAKGDWWGLAPVALVALSLWVFPPPAEYIVGGKDPGVYMNAGVQIAQRGSLVIDDELVASLPAETRVTVLSAPPGAAVLQQSVHGVLPSRSRPRHGYRPVPAPVSRGHRHRLRPGRAHRRPLRLSSLRCARRPRALLSRREADRQSVGRGRRRSAGDRPGAGVACANSELGGARAGVAAGGPARAGPCPPGRRCLLRASRGPVVGPSAVCALRRRAGCRPGRGGIGPPLDRRGPCSRSVCGDLDGRVGAFAPTCSRGSRRMPKSRGYGWRSTGCHWPSRRLAASRCSWPVVAIRRNQRLAAAIRRWVPHMLTAIVLSLAAYAWFLRSAEGKLALHDAESLRMFSWYVHPAAIAAALAGLAIVAPTAFWRDPGFFLVACGTAIFVFHRIRIVPEHFWVTRRSLPIILPAVLLGIAMTLLLPLAGRAGRRRARRTCRPLRPAARRACAGGVGILGRDRAYPAARRYAGVISRLEAWRRDFRRKTSWSSSRATRRTSTCSPCRWPTSTTRPCWC